MNSVETWNNLKWNNHAQWRNALWVETEGLLKQVATKGVPLEQLHEVGVYHMLRSSKEEFQTYYAQHKKVPETALVAHPIFPGIWCALFSPYNTFSYALSADVVKIHFRAEYKLFDRKLESHQKIWKAWQEAQGNLARPNSWENMKDQEETTFSEKMKSVLGYPGHVEFYKDHKFGAVVGYADYICPSIVLPEAIQGIEFIDLPKGEI